MYDFMCDISCEGIQKTNPHRTARYATIRNDKLVNACACYQIVAWMYS